MPESPKRSADQPPLSAQTKTVTVVRWTGATDIYDGREITAKQFKDEQGIFTQKKDLFFRKPGFFLRADEAEISEEALGWFRNSSEFKVEDQEVSVED